MERPGSWLRRGLCERGLAHRRCRCVACVTCRVGQAAAVVAVVCCAVGLGVSPAITLGERLSYGASSFGEGSNGSLGGALVTQGSPVEGEQWRAQRQVELAAPTAVEKRKASRTRFEHLGTTQALRVEREAFPAAIDEAAGGSPKLPAGERLLKYDASNAAAIALPEGKHGVVESLGPIAIPSRRGGFTPINLALRSTASGYAPVNSDVAVQIPKHVSNGVSMPSDGVSLTPVNEQGRALGGSEGVQEGASVVYANTQTDTDTLAKPTTGGFEVDSMLRSVNSPTTLYFRVGMPAGARLVGDVGRGSARVMYDGKTIATIAPVSAEDASGTSVSVNARIAGSILSIDVATATQEYDYPIDVDPRAYDETMPLPANCAGYKQERTNWEFYYSGGSFDCYSSGSADIMDTAGPIYAGEQDAFVYPAHGQAGVAYIEGEMAADASEQSQAVTKIAFAHEQTVEEEYKLTNAGEGFGRRLEWTCDELVVEEGVEHCRPYNNGNELQITQTDTARENAPEGYGFRFEVYNGTWVSVFQEKGPEVSFNTSESTIGEAGGRQNVLYGSGGWLGEYNGAVAITATDPGLGVSEVEIWDRTAHHEYRLLRDPIYDEHLCTGVWCNPSYKTYFTYGAGMAEGPNTFEVCAWDTARMRSCTTKVVNVDDTRPSSIKLTGIAEKGAELNATRHQITVEATDATSGVKSLAVSVDGKEIGSPVGSCTPGECTVSGTWTISGESLGAGEHTLVATATDYADNQKEYEIKFAIRNATPVKLGPGEVDPVTGQYTLSASDVDLAGAGDVSRTYLSRSLALGAEGALGPQWEFNLGSGQNLNILANGSAELRSSAGGSTTFKYEKGKFTAPPGDENISLEPKEREPGKDITEYLLREPDAGTTTVFTRPLEQQSVIPRYLASTSPNAPEYEDVNHIAIDSKGNVWGSASGSIDEFNSKREFVMAFGFGVKNGNNELETCTTSCKPGLQGGQKGEPSFTEALAADAKGNVWVVDGDNWIDEYNEHGGLVGQFAEETFPAYGHGSDEINHAKGIAVGANGNVWVADTDNSRVDEFNEHGAFIAAFGFGVLDGAHRLEVCTTVCQAGVYGSEAGEFLEPEGIAVHNGFVWVADTKNNRIEKFTENYEYVSAFGSKGTGDGQLYYPRHIATDSKGDLWVVDSENSRIEEFSEAGSYLGQFGETGSESEQLHWYNFWAGGGGVAVDGLGNVWVSAGSSGNNWASGGPMKEWAHSTWLPTKTEDPASGDDRVATYRATMVGGSAVSEPIEQLGPVPAGVSCGKNPAEVGQSEVKARLEELHPGCRALSFTYAESTTATGESPSEWGEYNGRLAKISFTGYNPSSKKMETTAVAQYSYDKQGRLRAEWDPRIEASTACGKSCAALKTTYGYDAEGHVTALTQAGEQPWAFVYGTIPGEGSTGRLLKVTRTQPKSTESEAEVEKKLGERKEAPQNTEEPRISGSPTVGTRMAVSQGVWSNQPIVYAYQWERTKAGTSEPILGATNANYTPVNGDVGYTLRVRVSAINGGGAATAVTTATSVIRESRTEKTEGEYHAPQPGATIEYHVPLVGSEAPYQMTSAEMAKWGQRKDLPVEATAIFPPDEPQGWPAGDYKRASIGYLDAQAREVDATAPSGAISTVEYNSLNEVTRTLSAGDRAIAMKEPCESETKCKSAEISEKLDSESKYNGETKAEKEQEEKEGKHEPGVRRLEQVGPEHMVRLPGGTEEETRDRQKFSYDEGAKEAEEKNKETYNVVTKETDVVESVSTKEIVEEQGKVFGYGGQKDLGWKLRKPTTVTEEPVKGKPIAKRTTYEETTGSPIESSISGSIKPPVYAYQFGSHGSGNGQFEVAEGVAVDPRSGDVYVADYELSRVEKFSPSGGFLAWVGSEKSGSGEGQLSHPESVAVSSQGNVYVGDAGNHRVEEFNSEGKYVRAFGKEGAGEGQFGKAIYGLAFDGKGRLWVTDGSNHRIERFSETGTPEGVFGEHGTGEKQFEEPRGIAVSGNDVYVVDTVNNDVLELSLEGRFVRQIGGFGLEAGQLREPWGIAIDSEGDLFVGDRYPDLVEEFDAAGEFVAWVGSSGTGEGQFEDPDGLAMSAAGQLYVADQENDRVDEWELVPSAPLYTAQFGGKGSENGQLSEPKGVAVVKNGNVLALDMGNDRIEEFSPSGKYEAKFGSKGSGSGQMKTPYGFTVDAKGNIWIADTGNNRVDEFNEKHEFVQAFGWNVNKSEGKLEVCTTSCKTGGTGGTGAASGEFNEPKGIAVTSGGDVYVSDTVNNRVQEFTEKGEFIATFGFDVNEKGAEQFEVCTTKCQAGKAGSGNGEFNVPIGLAVDAAGNIWVADRSNSRVEEFNSEDKYLFKFGEKGSGAGQLDEAKGVAVDSAGNLWVADSINNRVQEFTRTGKFLAVFGDKGTGNGAFEEPWGIAFGVGTVYVGDNKNSRVQEWTPAPGPGNEGANDTRTTYYTAAANEEDASCGGHPEWANLVCQTEPVAQPGDSGTPPLPVITTTYNMWDEPETIIEKIGSVTRTTTKKYDSAGREVESEKTSTSSEDKALSAVADEYSSETGALVKQTEPVEGKTKTIASVFNTLGQLTSYTDAEGSTTKYAYDVDGRVEEVSEPKGKQIYAYDPTTGFMTKLQDSAAGMFTATYGVAGELLTVAYPNGMTAKYTDNTIGQATNLEYEKTTDCKEKCVWFSDTEAFGPDGDLAYQASTLSTETYSYDELGRLTQTQETPVGGKGCITRLYGYSEVTNERLSLTTREPNEKGECSTEGGVVEDHAYDVAGRLLDPGVTYDALGNMTSVPALDAGGHAITSSFYVDNQVATQEQNEKSIAYTYDPSGRTMATKTTTKSGATTAIAHYAGPGDALTWTCEETTECKEEKETRWTRDIPGIDGALDAIQTNDGTPELELHDLQGNIIATASLSETATEPLTKHNVTEFGVPVGTAPKFSWLGASGAESELGTGVITTAGATYVPQLARTIQTEGVVPPGAAPNGVMDTRAYAPQGLSWTQQSLNESAANTIAEQRALEQEEMEAEFGSASDPKGAISGGEAKRLAEYFEDEAFYLGEALEDGVGSLRGSEEDGADSPVAEMVDAGIALYYAAAKDLKQCSKDVHTPIYAHYFGEKVLITGVCFTEFWTRPWEGYNVITSFRLEDCWQEPADVAANGSNPFLSPWECESGPKSVLGLKDWE
jgi:tripartite motif-containing protein 71